MPPFLHTSTFITPSLPTLHGYLRHLVQKHGKQGRTCIFSLSNNFRNEALAETVAIVRGINGLGENRAGQTIGCLAGTFDSVDVLGGPATQHRRGPVYSCAVAVADEAITVPFSSSLGPDAQPQVGRWHSFRKAVDVPHASSSLDEGDLSANEWSALWGENALLARGRAPPLPDALQAQHLSTILYFTSPRASQLLHSMDTHLLKTQRLGAIASPTYFSTGRDVTLFHNDSILSQGAVGIAFKRTQAANGACDSVTLDLGDVEALSDVLPVTACEGNIINTVAGRNPSQIVLDAMRRLRPSSTPTGSVVGDGEVYLAVIDPAGRPYCVYKVTAGDPAARGGMVSLETDRAPDVGTHVQFFYQRPISTVPFRSLEVPEYGVRFAIVPDAVAEGDWVGEYEAKELQYFAVPLSTGAYHAQSGKPSSVCTLPGSSLII